MTLTETLPTRPVPPIVLIVNDEPDTVEMYERLLCQGHSDELWVTGGAQDEAIEYALDLRPDIVLSDVDPRGASAGREFLRNLRAEPRLQTVPILLISGGQPDEAIEQLVDAVLVKPVDPEVLRSNVRSVLQQSQRLRATHTSLRQSAAAVIARAQRAVERSEAAADKIR